MIENKPFAFGVVASLAMLCGCASQPVEDKLQPSAVKVAQQRGASELACPAAVAEVLRKRAVEEAETTGWSEAPRSAEYTVAVSGCGKGTTYLVACRKFHSACETGPVPTAARLDPLGELADELRPDAIKAAQQRGSKDFVCPSTTAQVARQETIVDGQATGWDAEAPHRAVYAVKVNGCGKQTAYLIECDKRKKACATGGLQETQAGPRHPELADELQPRAVLAARERGSKELDCLAAAAQVQHQETLEEGSTTGWYDPPYRAIYTITISGCGKQKTYFVACNRKQNRCAAASPGSS